VSGFVELVKTHAAEIGQRTFEHVALSFGATALATAIGVPLGVVALRRARLERPLLSFVDAAQTVPSLALFGLLLPLPIIGGIGATPAVVALVLYALLPVVRTTVVGVRGVDASIVDAARGLGMTDNQLLRRVQLPLALPTILAGVRVAAVTSIGTATIAAAIGAGGLGTFVFQGVAMVDNGVILLGAVPAALLALVVDQIVRVAERRVARRIG
jgi:osmoprotectant transport system permease protein